MTPELITAIIACLGAIAAWFKARTDVTAIREERSATKKLRDEDSQKMHDDILKLQFNSIQNKDNIGQLFNQVADSNKQISLLTTQLSEVLIKMDNVINTLKEMKEEIRNG